MTNSVGICLSFCRLNCRHERFAPSTVLGLGPTIAATLRALAAQQFTAIDRITQARATAVDFSPRWFAAVDAVADVDSRSRTFRWCLCDHNRFGRRRAFSARLPLGRPCTAAGTTETTFDRLPIVSHDRRLVCTAKAKNVGR